MVWWLWLLDWRRENRKAVGRGRGWAGRRCCREIQDFDVEVLILFLAIIAMEDRGRKGCHQGR